MAMAGSADYELIKVIDPRMDYEQKNEYVALVSCLQLNYVHLPSNTNGVFASASSGSIQVQTLIPNYQTLVNRRVHTQVQFQNTFYDSVGGVINIGGSGGSGQTIFSYGSGTYAPRSFPWNSCCSTTQCQIDDKAVNITTNQIFQPYLRYRNRPEVAGMFGWSVAPVYPLDGVQDYFQGTGDYATNDYPPTREGPLGQTNRNPLAGYFRGDACVDMVGGRSSWILDSTAANLTAGQMIYTTYEPLIMLDPFSEDVEDFRALARTNKMDFQFTISNLNRNLSLDWIGLSSNPSNTTHPLGSVVCAFTPSGTPIINYEFLTPQPSVLSKIPASIVYPYMTYQVNNGTIVNYTVPAGGWPGLNVSVPTQVISNLQVNGNASHLMLYGKVIQYTSAPGYGSVITPAYGLTDTYLPLRNINITYNTLPAILGNATPQDLYQIVLKNGYNGSYVQFQDWVGAPALLRFGEDIPLSYGTVPGQNTGNNQIQIQVSYGLPSSWNWTPNGVYQIQFYVIIANEGDFVKTDGSSNFAINPISEGDLSQAKMAALPAEDFKEIQGVMGAGRTFRHLARYSHGLRRGRHSRKGGVLLDQPSAGGARRRHRSRSRSKSRRHRR